MRKEKHVLPARAMDLTKEPPFGRLTAVAYMGKAESGAKLWKCICECGNECVVQGGALTTGHTRSCGCYFREISRSTNTKHGESGKNTSPEYVAWSGMIDRCYREKNKSYHRYGGRGIKVCGRWRSSFEVFLADMGRKPSQDHSIDRYPNGDGDYEPGNCRWATDTEQARNTARNVLLTWNGVTKCVNEWAEEVGIHWRTIHHRVRLGWQVERMLTERPRPSYPRRKTA